MTKPCPTVSEVRARLAARDRSFCAPTDEALEIIIREACDLDREHREVAEVERIDWAEYPWATHVAKDASGHVCAYARKPYRSKRAKIDDQWFVAGRARNEFINATIPGPWQDSLRARPEGV